MGASASVQDYANRLNGLEMAALLAEGEDKARSYLSEKGITDDEEIAKIISYFGVSHQNSAFLFIKPHANNAAVQALVNKALTDNKLTIVSEGKPSLNFLLHYTSIHLGFWPSSCSEYRSV